MIKAGTESTVHGANDYAEPHGAALAAYARRHLALIASEDLSTERRLVAEKIIHLSFDAGRSVARLPDQLRLCIITGLHKSDVSRAVTALIRARMLERWQAHGETLYRFSPHAEGWAVRWRQPDARARQLAIDTEAWLFSLNEAAPQEQDLPLPPEPLGLDDALAEVSRESALADEQRGRHFPQRVSSLTSDPSHPSDRARLDAGAPDIKRRPCRQPSIREQQPVAGAREMDAPATAPTSDAAGLPAAPTTSDAPRLLVAPTPTSDRAGLLALPTTSDPAGLLAAPTSDAPALADATSESSAAPRPGHLSRMLRAMLATPGGASVPVGHLANSASADTGQGDPASWLPSQLEPPKPPVQLATWPTPRERVRAPARATDGSEHLKHPSSLKLQLPSGIHPDVPDGCCRHEEDPDGASRPDAKEWTGNLHADLRQAMGEAGWGQYRTAWQTYVAADRLTVVEVLGDYRQAVARAGRRSPIRNPGAWMRQRFLATSQAWRERVSPASAEHPRR